MFCTNCGNEVEQVARFCSKCGHAVSPDVPAGPTGPTPSSTEVRQKPPHDMNMHINILGWLFVGCGVLFGLFGMTIIFAGQILQHLPINWPPDVPFGMIHFAGWVSALIGLVTVALGGGVAAAGAGLLQYKSWARVLAIIMAIILLFKFPVGTAIAVFGFWVLFSEQGQQYYKSRAASTMA
jgi:hypothetical protein